MKIQNVSKCGIVTIFVLYFSRQDVKVFPVWTFVILNIMGM